ncbi:MAG: ATP-dependent DNA ligase [archaeon YNP-WB-062]|jgi:DNA ligase-1|nr:ATP-dependent DNA ligase [Candidatus Culexarchaeum yellowstonense]
MLYSEIVDVYEKIEATTKRLEMTDLLVNLLRKTPKEVIDKVIYLTQGKLYPDYYGIEIGLAERLALRALSEASGITVSELEDKLSETGDIGLVAEYALQRRKIKTLTEFLSSSKKTQLTVLEVYNTLDEIAKTSGEGAQDKKIRLLAGILKKATPREGKYIMRTVTGRLRLGIADMTILDALAITFAQSKDARAKIERAYNVSNDLGEVAKKLAEEGLRGMDKIKIVIGRPIRPMLAERLSTAKEIMEKLGGSLAAEYKYDGERIQAHKNGDNVILFSRRSENITHHYPDVCELIRSGLKAKEAVVEGEAVAVNTQTGEFLPFQELMHRRRKYGIEEAMEKYPVTLFLFDVLYVDGEEMLDKPYLERRKKLEEIVIEGERVRIATSKIIKDPEELEKFFMEAVEIGCEGLVCKSIAPDSIYQAGARGWLWIKYKRDYKSEMTDTVDLVVVGAFWGKGKRAGSYGALLMAAYDDETDTFKTVCKVGSGFTDEDLEKLPSILEPYKIPHPHARVDAKLEADVWFTPAIVLEILGAEITLSPIHTCALNKIREGAGLAIRFPRFTGKYRTDKKPEDATTVNEIIEMYKMQLKKIEEQ